MNQPTPPTRMEHHLTLEGAAVAVELLAAETGLSKGRIKQAMVKGAVWVTHGKKTQRLRRATKALSAGDTLHLYYDERVLAMTAPEPRLIADERGYSLWYKPSGLLSQGSQWGDHCAITRWAEQQLKPQRPVFVVHRLDREATGLILLAHDKRMAGELSKRFQERAMEKRYRVVVHGRLAEGPRVIDAPIEGRAAFSRVEEIAYDAERDRSLLEVAIDTGRKHQIRLHLAGIGLPVVGDRLHGRPDDREDLQLTAYHLAFRCPRNGAEKRFTLPDELLPTLSGGGAPTTKAASM